MHVHTTREQNGKHSLVPTKFTSTSNCPVPKCTSCELAHAKKHNPQVVQWQAIKEKESILALDKYQAGDFVSMDQFVISTPCWLLTAYDQEGNQNHFYGGTIFSDAATRTIWVENQVSVGAGETNMAKTCFEEWLWVLACTEIKHIHSNSGVFTADVFQADCTEKHQSQNFSKVDAHHQNAHAEHAIQTITYMAWTFMLHVSLH